MLRESVEKTPDTTCVLWEGVGGWEIKDIFQQDVTSNLNPEE